MQNEGAKHDSKNQGSKIRGTKAFFQTGAFCPENAGSRVQGPKKGAVQKTVPEQIAVELYKLRTAASIAERLGVVVRETACLK